MKKAYAYDDEGILTGEVQRQVDPLRSKKEGKTVYLLPAQSTEVQPPNVPEGKLAKWNGQAWRLEDMPVKEPETSEEEIIESSEQPEGEIDG